MTADLNSRLRRWCYLSQLMLATVAHSTRERTFLKWGVSFDSPVGVTVSQE